MYDLRYERQRVSRDDAVDDGPSPVMFFMGAVLFLLILAAIV
jgi:hypothetical protein